MSGLGDLRVLILLGDCRVHKLLSARGLRFDGFRETLDGASKFAQFDNGCAAKELELPGGMSARQIKTGFFSVVF